MKPTVSSNPHSRNGIRLRSLTQYEYTTPVDFSAMASYDTPTHNAPGWNVIVRDLEMLAARPYLLKSPTRTFIACCIHSDSRETTMPLLEYKALKHRPTVSPSPSRATLWSFTAMTRQVLMTLSTTTLNSVGETILTCIVTLVAGKAGLWKPF